MNIREMTENIEKMNLSSFAALSQNTKGRILDEEKCEIRTDYQRDRDRILHSKAFRRLKHKTQVFITPEGDHYRTRLTHTLEVSQITRTIARGLRLNEDLAEAISLGHDLGHTPFGHAGEAMLNRIHPDGFKHNVQSLRVVDFLEGGNGLNLTYEVRDGILKHTGTELPETLEGKIIRFSDRIAYINHDIDDAIRGKIIDANDLPAESLQILGSTHQKRINKMISDVIQMSTGVSDIRMSPDVKHAMDVLRTFMFDHVYVASQAKVEEKKAQNIIRDMYDYFVENPSELPIEFQDFLKQQDINQVVCDYIAGMIYCYAIKTFQNICTNGMANVTKK